MVNKLQDYKKKDCHIWSRAEHLADWPEKFPVRLSAGINPVNHKVPKNNQLKFIWRLFAHNTIFPTLA